MVDQGDTVTQQRRGLGKGLGALIQATTSPSEPESVAAGAADPRSPYTPSQPGGASDESADAQPIVGAYFAEVATGSITPNPRQPRTTFDEDALDELASSIREVGLLQPVVVRQVMPGHYELIMGERRWRASQRADLINELSADYFKWADRNGVVDYERIKPKGGFSIPGTSK